MKGRLERRRQLLLFQNSMETVPPGIPITPHSSITPHLTAVFRALATISATFTSLLAQETTAHDGQAGHQAAAVLLLLRRRSLLHGRRLLVAHLLGWVAILLGWWAVALLLGRVLSLRRTACDVLAKCSPCFAMRVGI